MATPTYHSLTASVPNLYRMLSLTLQHNSLVGYRLSLYACQHQRDQDRETVFDAHQLPVARQDPSSPGLNLPASLSPGF